MSLSMKRLSRPENVNDKEFYLECKAAFLSLYNDIEDKIESKKALNSLLQQSGRNPTRSALDKYWPAKTEELTFTDFVEICKQEHVTTADDLMKAFRKIDTNGDGYISLDELFKIMNSKGENMTRDEVRKIIEEVDENKDGKLNYGEFTNMIMKTTEESKKFCMKVMEKKERKRNKAEEARSLDSARSVQTALDYDDDDLDILSTERPTTRIDLQLPRNETTRRTLAKEGRSDDNDLYDHKSANKIEKQQNKPYATKDGKDNNGFDSLPSLRTGDKELSVPVPSPRKTASPNVSADDVPKPSPRVKRDIKGKSLVSKNKDQLPDAMALRDWQHFTSKGCFFYEEDEIVTHMYRLQLATDSSVYMAACPIQEPSCVNLPGAEPVDTALFVFDSRGKLVACSEQRDTKGQYGVRCELKAGEYQVLPYTTGCRFKQRSQEYQDNMKESKLVKTVNNKIAITSAFRRALEDIFDLCDLDNNGTMSRDEFNWFNLRTSGEELGEDEWEVVEERTQLENGEITKKGFIELNEMEAEDANGDVEDLWITLTSMGMNKALIIDEACPYRVDIYVEEASKRRTSVKVTGIESLEKKEFVTEICQYSIEKAGEPVKIRNMKDLYMYTYRNEFRATIIIDNRSRSNVKLEADCSKSKNVDTNRPSLDYTLEIEPLESAIAHHLLPHSELSDWSVSCTETIHK